MTAESYSAGGHAGDVVMTSYGDGLMSRFGPRSWTIRRLCGPDADRSKEAERTCDVIVISRNAGKWRQPAVGDLQTPGCQGLIHGAESVGESDDFLNEIIRRLHRYFTYIAEESTRGQDAGIFAIIDLQCYGRLLCHY